MGKYLKKVFCGVLSFVLISSFSAGFVTAVDIGDVVDKILYTDIVTYIEGVKVPSYNIKGRTAVVVENLNKIGSGINFGVSFDEKTRVLTVRDTDVYATGSKTPVAHQDKYSSLAVGTPVGDVLYTDIKTYFEGELIESFNIGGLTCVYADDLGKLCGEYVWSEEERTVNVYKKNSEAKGLRKVGAWRALNAIDSAAQKESSFRRWAEPFTSYVIANSDNTFTAVEITENVNIETYDSKFKYINSFAIKKELPLFGNLYTGKEYNYIAFGQENLSEDDSCEVIKIVVYDKSFVKVREVSVTNCNTRVPFAFSGCDMYEDDRYLVLHTARSQYKEGDTSPQTQLTVVVDKKTWKVCNIIGKYQYNHTSHALQEFVKIDGDKIVTANLSDTTPHRGVFLQEMDFYVNVLKTTGILTAGGAFGANATGGMIGGLEISDSGYLVPVSAIDYSKNVTFTDTAITGVNKETRNIYVLWTDKKNSTQRHTCLAYYTDTEYTGGIPYIVKLVDGNFMVLWQMFGKENTSKDICYAYIDKSGNLIGSVQTAKGQLSDLCEPVVFADRVVWYVNTASGRDFYNIKVEVPEYTQITTDLDGNTVSLGTKPGNFRGETNLKESERVDSDQTSINESQESTKKPTLSKKPNKNTEVDGI